MSTLTHFEVIMQERGCCDRVSIMLSLTCSHLQSIAKNYTRKVVYGNVTLHSCQARVSTLIREIYCNSTPLKPSGIYLRAPVGFGKTILGLRAALSSRLTLILCKPSVIVTWEKEIKMRMPALYSNKATSPTLVYSPTRKNHFSVLKSGLIPETCRIVICSTTANIYKLDTITSYDYELVIVDEAHTLKPYVLRKVFETSLCNVLFISAENVSVFSNDDLQTHRININRLFNETDLLNYAYYKGTVQYELRTTEDIKTCTSSTLKEIYKKKNKIVIFFHSFKDQEEWEDANENNYNVFCFRRSLIVVDNFSKCKERAIITITQANCESLNLCGDYVVIPKVTSHISTKYVQMVGRLTRPSNPSKLITVITIETPDLAFRCLYYEVTRLCPLISTTNSELLSKVLSNVYGISVENVLLGDVATVCCILSGQYLDHGLQTNIKYIIPEKNSFCCNKFKFY